MAEKANINQLTELMALSDEISNVNNKVKQLIEGLHSTSDQIGNLKELTDRLTQKATGLSSGVNGYTPKVVEDPFIVTFIIEEETSHTTCCITLRVIVWKASAVLNPSDIIK